MRARGVEIAALLIFPQLTGRGLAGVVVKGALMYGAPAATIAKDVLDIDVSLRQDKPDKTPIEKALLPALVIPGSP